MISYIRGTAKFYQDGILTLTNLDVGYDIHIGGLEINLGDLYEFRLFHQFLSNNGKIKFYGIKLCHFDISKKLEKISGISLLDVVNIISSIPNQDYSLMLNKSFLIKIKSIGNKKAELIIRALENQNIIKEDRYRSIIEKAITLGASTNSIKKGLIEISRRGITNEGEIFKQLITSIS